MRTPTRAQLASGGLLLGVFWFLTKKKPEGDVVEAGEELVIGPTASASTPSPSFLMWEPGKTAPVPSAGTPGTLRVEVALDVSSLIVGLAMDKVRSDVLAPTKLKSLLAYVAKTCPTVPKMTGTATGGVAPGGPGLIITVRVPVLFTKQPDAAMKACVEAALKKSNSEVRSRMKSLTLKAER